MVVSRLETADHRHNAPPWTTDTANSIRDNSTQCGAPDWHEKLLQRLRDVKALTEKNALRTKRIAERFMLQSLRMKEQYETEERRTQRDSESDKQTTNDKSDNQCSREGNNEHSDRQVDC